MKQVEYGMNMVELENSVTMALKHREESGYTITYYYNMLRCSFICRNSCKLAPTPGHQSKSAPSQKNQGVKKQHKKILKGSYRELQGVFSSLDEFAFDLVKNHCALNLHTELQAFSLRLWQRLERGP